MERDIVWEELELCDLLALGQKTIEEQQREAIDKESRSHRTKVEAKQNKMMKKPSYAVLMNRYDSLPNKVKSITKAKIDKLADPILGRMTYLEQKQYEARMNIQPSNNGQQSINRIILKTDQSTDSFATHIISSHPHSHIMPKPSYDVPESSQYSSSYTANQRGIKQLKPIASDAFFMTEAIPEEPSYADDEQSPSPSPHKKPSHLTQLSPSKIINANIKSSRNGFTSMLRGRVNNAKKLNKLVKPLLTTTKEQDDIDKKEALLQAYRDRMEKMKLTNNAISKRNQVMMRRSKQRQAQLASMIADGSITEEELSLSKQKNNKASIRRDPLTGKAKKVASSGYGRMVTRYTNQPKPILPLKKKTKLKPSANPTISNPAEPESGNEAAIKRRNNKRQYRLAPLDPTAVAVVPLPRSKKMSSSSAPHLPRATATAAVDVGSQQQARSSSGSRQRTRSATNNLTFHSTCNSSSSNYNNKQMLLPGGLGLQVDPILNSSQESVSSYTKRRSQPSSLGIKAKIDAIMQSPHKASPPRKIKLKSPGKKPTTAEKASTVSKEEEQQLQAQEIKRPTTDQRAITTIEDNIREVLKQDENKITTDIALSIQRLQQFESTILDGDLYTKPDTTATLYKRAEKLGGHLQAAEAILKEYESLRDDDA